MNFVEAMNTGKFFVSIKYQETGVYWRPYWKAYTFAGNTHLYKINGCNGICRSNPNEEELSEKYSLCDTAPYFTNEIHN
jgi:hypothetical protein